MTTQDTAGATPAPAAAAPVTRQRSPFDLLRNEIDRAFDRFAAWPTLTSDSEFSPSMEVTETDSTIAVSTELPGINEKDIEVSVSGNILTIRGDKTFEKEETERTFRVVERSYGAFERVVALPAGVDVTRITARMTRGVLKLEVPKPPPAKAEPVRIRTD